jgi:hypothetical protein
MVLAGGAINVHENAFGCQPDANSHHGHWFTGFVHGAMLTKIGKPSFLRKAVVESRPIPNSSPQCYVRKLFILGKILAAKERKERIDKNLNRLFSFVISCVLCGQFIFGCGVSRAAYFPLGARNFFSPQFTAI